MLPKEKKFRLPSIRRSDFYLLPNLITLTRVAAVPLVAGCAYLKWNWAAAALFALAGLSDYADGYVARKYNYESRLGMLLDPLADKLVIVSTMIMLLWLGRLDLVWFGKTSDILPPTLVIVTVGREIAITGLRGIASSMGMILPAERGGKFKTWIQFFAIIFLLLDFQPWRSLGEVLIVISVLAALWSGLQYIFRFVSRLPT